VKAIIVYDSVYGNTENIAKAMAEAIAPPGEARALRAGEASPSELESPDLLIVGSPTHGGQADCGSSGFSWQVDPAVP
jgi:flavodoxin